MESSEQGSCGPCRPHRNNLRASSNPGLDADRAENVSTDGAIEPLFPVQMNPGPGTPETDILAVPSSTQAMSEHCSSPR